MKKDEVLSMSKEERQALVSQLYAEEGFTRAQDSSAPWSLTADERAYEKELVVPDNPGYSSISGTDRASMVMCYNLWTKPAKRLKECCGQVLEITDLMCETVQMQDREGVMRATPRIVLVDKDMQGYVCLSVGVFNQLKKLIQVFGPPHWEEPLKIKPYLDRKKSWEILTFELIP